MRRICSMILIAATVLSLCACGAQKADVADVPTWQEQYDLGVRYLSDGNYEEAIIAFMAAIEIDPKQPDAYLKAAETYEVMGDMEAALAILQRGVEATQSESLREQLAALTQIETGETGVSEETAPTETYYGNRWESAPWSADRMEIYVDEELEEVFVTTEWNDYGLPVKMEGSDQSGGQLFVDIQWNDQGQIVQVTEIYVDNEWRDEHTVYYQYDDLGRILPIEEGYTYEYDEQGRVISETYEMDGNLYINEMSYDEQGRMVKSTGVAHYEEGTLSSQVLYIYND